MGGYSLEFVSEGGIVGGKVLPLSVRRRLWSMRWKGY